MMKCRPMLCFMLLWVYSAYADTPAPYPITIDSRSQVTTVSPLVGYQGEPRSYLVSFKDGTNVSDISASSPYMVLASNLQSTVFITSSWVFVNSGTGGQSLFTFDASSMNITGDWNFIVGANATYRHGDIRVYANPHAVGIPAATFTSNQNLAGYTFTGQPWIEDITISSGTVWAITDTGVNRVLTVNTNSGYDGGITNNVGNSGNITFTNNGRQSYATLNSVATGTPIYVETGNSNTVVQGQTSNLSSTNSGRQNFLTITGLVQSNGTNSVTTEMIVDGTIQNGDISSSAAITATKISNTGLTQATTFTGDVAGVWSALTLQNSSVTSSKILDGTITNDDITANAAIAVTKILGTAATTAQLAGAISSFVFSDSNYPNAILRSGVRTLTSAWNVAHSMTNVTSIEGTGVGLNFTTHSSLDSTIYTNLNADLFDGFDSIQLRTNQIVQGQTGYVSSSNANRQLYLTVTGFAGQAELTIATNALATNVLLKLNNLSDLASASTARSNLGLGTAATNAYTSSVFNASQISDFAVATNDPTSAQILIVNSSIYTPKTINGDVSMTAGGVITVTNPLSVSQINTTSLSTVFATDVELAAASNALRTTAGVLATSVWADAQYPNAVLRDGTRSMTGDLDLDENDIVNVASISGFGLGGFNFETHTAISNTVWTSLNADMVDGIHGTNVLLNTTPQTAEGPLTLLNSLSVLTNVIVASSNSLGSELLSNGGFTSTNADGTLVAWNLSSCSLDPAFKIYVAPGASATITYTSAVPFAAYKTYQLSFLNDIDTGTNPTLYKAAMGGVTNSLSSIADGTYKFKFTTENGSQQLTFSITPGTNTVFLDTVSLKEITQGDAQFADDVFIGGRLRVAEDSVFSSNVTAASVGANTVTGSTITATTFIGTLSGVSTSFVAISGSTMAAPLTNNAGYYGNGIGITNLSATANTNYALKVGDILSGPLTGTTFFAQQYRQLGNTYESGGVVVFGTNNLAYGGQATVGGGTMNIASGAQAVVSGGFGNTNISNYGTIGGGELNENHSSAGTISGGVGNFSANASIANVIGGGYLNVTSNDYVTVIGGNGNSAIADYSTVLGGYANLAAGNYSLAAGFSAHANNAGSFVWNDTSSGNSLDSTANNQWMVSAGGGVIFTGLTAATTFDIYLNSIKSFSSPTNAMAANLVLTADSATKARWTRADGVDTSRVVSVTAPATVLLEASSPVLIITNGLSSMHLLACDDTTAEWAGPIGTTIDSRFNSSQNMQFTWNGYALASNVVGFLVRYRLNGNGAWVGPVTSSTFATQIASTNMGKHTAGFDINPSANDYFEFEWSRDVGAVGDFTGDWYNASTRLEYFIQ